MKHERLLLVGASVIVGGLAGAVAAIGVTGSLRGDALEIAALLNVPSRLSEERPLSAPATYLQALRQVSERAAPSVVQLFSVKSGASFVVDADEAVARGVVLTSDGWVLSMPVSGVDMRRLTAVVGGKAYGIERVVTDPASGAVFIKLPIANLSVVTFGKGIEAGAGAQAFLLSSADRIRATSIVGSWFDGALAHSSDKPSRRLMIADMPDATPAGTPVFDSAGSLLGVLEQGTEQVRALPLESVLPAFTALLAKDVPMRATLGVTVVDRSRTAVVGETSTADLQGALVSVVPSASSPAFVAGVREGDVILAVNGASVDARHTLDERVAEYAPGDRAELTVLRGTETRHLSVTFGP